MPVRNDITAVDIWAFEKDARANGYGCIAGVDEAGRGPLAGPVVAAAVVLPMQFDPAEINDSKKLSESVRERMFDYINENADAVGVGIVDPETIDRINILRATHLAMRAALDNLGAAFDFILVDGNPVSGLPAPSKAIVKGDSRSVSIAAASIIAKVTRDRIMADIARLFPDYGFEIHKGYGTRGHLAAIEEFGPCDCHRKSFSPIAEKVSQCLLPGFD